MLDLTTMNTQQYEIRLLDGTELHLKRPSQAMEQYLINLRDLNTKGNERAMLDAFSELFRRILNRNEEGVTFNKASLEDDYNFQTIGYVIKDYFDYWESEVAQEVNFPQGQQEQ